MKEAIYNLLLLIFSPLMLAGFLLGFAWSMLLGGFRAGVEL